MLLKQTKLGRPPHSPLDQQTIGVTVNRQDHTEPEPVDGEPRRSFLGQMTWCMMAGGLAAGYGVFAAYAGRFLYPAKRNSVAWHFVTTLDQLTTGDAMAFETPTGAKVVVARQSEGDTVEHFIALSSVCPHLGCAVHWEPQNDRFFCPCHNGAFDASGKATEGPPEQANQELSQFPLKVENGSLYMEVPTESIAQPREA